MPPAESAGRAERLQIGRVAELTELSIRTLRHYDEVGLVTPSDRSDGGFRLYTARDVDRLLAVRAMKPLGFSLAEVRRLLDTLDALDGTDASEEDTRAAAAFVSDCHVRAQERCRALARQLGWAEEFRDLLAARG